MYIIYVWVCDHHENMNFINETGYWLVFANAKTAETDLANKHGDVTLSRKNRMDK